MAGRMARSRLPPGSRAANVLEAACGPVDRDPADIGRTFDLYTVVPEKVTDAAAAADFLGMEHPIAGTSEQIAEYILSLGALGFEEVRCDLFPKTSAAIEAMQTVVDLVHRG
jgi:hypothetical protein